MHTNMRGHTGGFLSMGRGFPIFSSTKHNMNKQSSTETEILSVVDCMTAVIYTRYCLNSQGYDVLENILYQDNKSDILLENNGKDPISKVTKNINII